MFSDKIQCQYFVLKKKRLCRMTVKAGETYCGEHIDHVKEPSPVSANFCHYPIIEIHYFLIYYAVNYYEKNIDLFDDFRKSLSQRKVIN